MDTVTKSDTGSTSPLVDLTKAEFDNSFVRALPADAVLTNVPRAVRNASYTRVDPTPVPAPRLLAWSDSVGEMLGIARPASLTGPVAEVLAGSRVLPGMQPYAARYGGHQFGHWAGQLGDGRAITLGEVVNAQGARYELQLKGAGLTPYSRTADGRAVLRSSVREFMCSEAMHHLGVPTTRALSLAATGAAIVRDMFYDGNPAPEPGSVVCRVAPSFVRFGNFQILAAHNELDLLKQLADYVITTHYPALLEKAGAPLKETYARWFEEICRRTALMIVDWMRVGFVHGVMNTDNMSILGLTIDYGPYGWLEGYDPSWTPNTTDAEGRRYCYGEQPQIAHWNLVQLANALYPLIEDKAPLERGLEVFVAVFQQDWQAALLTKLGLSAPAQENDKQLKDDLFALLEAVETDFTLFFRLLTKVPLDETASDAALIEPLRRAFYADVAPAHVERLAAWLRRYIARVRSDKAPAQTRVERMNRVNPKYVFRNYLAQLAIDALTEKDDGSVMNRLMTVLQCPYDEQPEHAELAERRPEWARNRAGCSALS
ncbi:MAG: protein adenylyltransferase SelO [Burkholderiales bacterium]